MNPRKASLRVAHKTTCDHANKNSEKSALRGKRGCDDSCKDGCGGCKCEPTFYTFYRDHQGKPKKGKRYDNKEFVKGLVDDLQRDLNHGREGIKEERNILFPDWVEEYKRIIQQRVASGTNKPTTLAAYTDTLDRLAAPAIGYQYVHHLDAREYQAFFDAIAGLGPATKLQHLRHLRACLGAAVRRGYATSDILDTLRNLKDEERLRAPKRGKAPFDDGELERLWAEYRRKMGQAAKPWPAVYLHMARFAAETGLRLGEARALRLDDLRGTDLHVTKTLGRYGEVKPKTGENRIVFLTPQATAVLADWLPLRGDTPGYLFCMPQTPGEPLLDRQCQRMLDKAMEGAGIPKLHPDLELPRSFHSLRYTTSVLMQRRGYNAEFIRQTLGHATLDLTFNVYGRWTHDQMRAEAAREAVADRG